MKNRDGLHLEKLRDFYAEHRVLPSFSVIAALLGLKSTSAVSAMAQRMKAADYLQAGPDRRLKPGKRFFEREVVGVIQAGLPQQGTEPEVEGMNIDAYLVEHPSRTMLLTVRGDSMIEAGLMPGDAVIVKRNVPTRLGDIVVAVVDNEFTVKYLAQDKDGYFLRPGNKAYSPIRARNDLEILGVVVGAFRKYI